jgi:hypothetical protein
MSFRSVVLRAASGLAAMVVISRPIVVDDGYLVDNDRLVTRIHCGAQSEEMDIGFGFFGLCRPASVACCRAPQDGRSQSIGRMSSSVQFSIV